MSQLNPKFIYFDLDDTLLDHKKAERGGLRDILGHFDFFDGVSENQLLDTYHHINKGLWEAYSRAEIGREELQRRRFEETLQALKLDPEQHEATGKQYMQYYRNHWEWMDGARDAYHKIADTFDVGIITNGFAETQWLKIDRFNFKDTARHIVISEEVGEMKPHPKVFDHATELAGVNREDILYVGDSFTSDVVGGSKANWQVAWYTKTPIEQGHKLAHLIFDDFEELLEALGVD
ncbi:HAD family hydrolase [Gracilimonas mengyeensis]|uniref:Putative hydrolase of the HAD superfamily n=1 Tax=Gracilimonas mengyeensis TaxID=1302730 RepID=A0A521BCZ0_9BACT|nr:HAD-IA family hydrolase [Gracilimonas mengyeensis]SMO44964.1 putative hydrolase of the HAD superfamily [Gracilimonas mengyeensis]